MPPGAHSVGQALGAQGVEQNGKKHPGPSYTKSGWHLGWRDVCTRTGIPAQIAAWHEALAVIPATDTDRREMLTWTIRRAERRMAALDARLANTRGSIL